ncbi:hypothetical protein HNP03_002443 [Pseudomonas rhodesiae]|nr:hypothetical protein [Pseudomonas rhodesiae]
MLKQLDRLITGVTHDADAQLPAERFDLLDGGLFVNLQ